MLKKLSLTLATAGLLAAIPTFSAIAQEAEGTIVFRYHSGVLASTTGGPAPVDPGNPGDPGDPPGNGNDDEDEGEGNEDEEEDEEFDPADLGLELTYFGFSGQTAEVPSDQRQVGGYALFEISVTNNADQPIDFSNPPADVNFTGFAGWEFGEYSCWLMGTIEPGETETCVFQSNPFTEDEVCSGFYWYDDQGFFYETLPSYLNPAIMMTWDWQSFQESNRGDWDVEYTDSRVGCEPFPSSGSIHGPIATSGFQGTLRAGHRIAYRMSIVNDHPSDYLSSENRSHFVSLDPVPGGDLLQSLGVPEQRICTEYSVEPGVQFSCDPVYSKEITQNDLCNFPGDRIAGTIGPGNERIEGDDSGWRAGSTTSFTYNLELDKSGCDPDT